MADNLQLNAGTGGGILATASLTISGDTASVQRIACGILSGSEGSWAYTTHPGGAGVVDAGTPRVTLASDDPAVAKLTTIDGKITACNTGAVVIASGSCAVTNAGTFAVQATQAGTWNVGTVTTVTSITNAVTVQDGGGSITVDGTVAVSGFVAVTGTFWQATQPVSAAALPLPTGASTLGEQQTQTTAISNAVTALQVIDDWDENDRTKVNLIVGQAGVSAGAGAVDVTTQRTTLANDDPAVAKLTTIDEDTGTISSVVSTLNGKVTACNTGAVVVSSALPAGTNAIGKLAANSGVDIGDVDVLTIAAGTNTIGGVISQASTSAAYDSTTACTIKRESGIATASGDNTVLAAVADKKFRVLALTLLATSTTSVSLYVYNGDHYILGDTTNKMKLHLTGVDGPAGFSSGEHPRGFVETDATNEALKINLSAAQPVIWVVSYIEVA